MKEKIYIFLDPPLARSTLVKRESGDVPCVEGYVPSAIPCRSEAMERGHTKINPYPLLGGKQAKVKFGEVIRSFVFFIVI